MSSEVSLAEQPIEKNILGEELHEPESIMEDVIVPRLRSMTVELLHMSHLIEHHPRRASAVPDYEAVG